MSLLTGIRKYSKTIAKGSLYVAGGLAIAWPLIEGAQAYANGQSFKDSANVMVYQATGYTATGNVLVQKQTGTAIVRTAIGLGTIYAASKI